MSTHIVPLDTAFVTLDQIPQAFPQLSIEHVLAFHGPPAPAPPVRNPLSNTSDDVGGVGIQGDAAGRLPEMRQRFNRSGKFHPVVGGMPRPATELAYASGGRDHDRTPTPRSGVAFCGPVGKDDDGSAGLLKEFHRLVSVRFSMVTP